MKLLWERVETSDGVVSDVAYIARRINGDALYTITRKGNKWELCASLRTQHDILDVLGDSFALDSIFASAYCHHSQHLGE